MQIENNIQRGIVPLTNKTKTKCTKMTDESDLIKNGINGASTSVAKNDSRINVIPDEKLYGSESVTAAAATAVASAAGNIVNTKNSSGCSSSNNNNNNNNNNSSSSNSSGSIRRKCGLVSLPNNEQDDNQATSNVAWPHQSNVVSETPSSAVINNLDVHSSQQGIGGRLQFFKDGKFILELARTREGEKEGWISVPRKTFWPLSTNTIVYPKNESSASLSFSDDNSSIQSSPWQRDHCWKQSSPRKNISKEMCMFFKRTKKFTLSKFGYKIAQVKRRKPYDATNCKIPFITINGLLHMQDEDVVDGKVIVKLERKDEVQTINGESKKIKSRAKLTGIIQKLIDRLPTGLFYLSKTAVIGGAVHHFSSTTSRITDLHHPQQHVSPRKRILRELEKVTLEDSNNKRCRAKSSTAFTPSVSSVNSTVHSTQAGNSSQNTTTSNSNRSGQVMNGNTVEQSAPVSTPSRLYSSYSIHSLLGNVGNSKSEQKDTSSNQHSKEGSDPSYLRIMLNTPKQQQQPQDTGKSPSAFTNHIKKSPTYSSYYDAQNLSKSPSTDMEQNTSRFKSIVSTTVPSSTSFHPYLSSPKYSSSSSVLSNTSNDNYKIRSGRTSGSPNHQINASINRRSSPLSAFTPSTQTGAGTRFNNQTSPNNNRIKEISTTSSGGGGGGSGNISPRLDRRGDNTPRTVPKKTAALRQQFSAPSTSPSISSQGGESSLIYTSTTPEQKKKNLLDDRSLSPEQQLYHSSVVDIDHSMSSVLRSPAIPPSALYYIYPRHGSPSAHTSPSYIPPVSYYHPYAAAVAALRNPLWMHYQAGVVPAASGPPSRLGPSMFPYNGASPGPPPLPSPLSSMHLSTGSLNPWTPSSQQILSTEDPVSLASKKDEQSSDIPLNLSKH